MIRIHAIAAVAALSLLSAPAFAQTLAANPPANQTTAAAPVENNIANANACRSMIRQMNSVLPTLNAGRRNEARKHVDLAKAALEQNNDAACVSNMQTAMNVLK